MKMAGYYQDFFNAFKKAHSFMNPQDVQKQVNEKWADMKKGVKAGNLTTYHEQMNALKLKAVEWKSHNQTFMLKFLGSMKSQSKPVLKPIEELVISDISAAESTSCSISSTSTESTAVTTTTKTLA